MNILGIFFYHNLPYSLRQGISLNLKFVIQARLASQFASLLSKLGLQLQADMPSFYIDAEMQIQLLMLALTYNFTH